MRYEDSENDIPIRSHPASKEYRANYDTIDWGDDSPGSSQGAEARQEAPAPGESESASAVREYLAAGGEPSPIGLYGVITLDKPRYSCEKCCDTGCVLDPNADPSTFVTEADGLVNCDECSIRGKQLP